METKDSNMDANKVNIEVNEASIEANEVIIEANEVIIEANEANTDANETNNEKDKDKDNLVRFDWAIKRLLRDKANFDVLEGFLSVVLHEEVKIKEIIESEGNKQTADDKFNRVDIKAKNKKGEIIIIEVQNTREVDYLLRILYGVAKTVTEHIKTGEAYKNISKVYSISILYFNLGLGDDYVYRGQTEFKGIHSHTPLILTEEQRKLMGFMEPRTVFPEYYLMMVQDFNKVATTPLEEWISYLKTGKISPDAKAPGLQEAREKLRVIAMSKTEQNAYEKYLHDVASFMLTQKVEREFALSEGEKKNAYKTARKMLADGVDMAIIIKYTDLTKEEIESISLEEESKDEVNSKAKEK